jgi:putative redox protein
MEVKASRGEGKLNFVIEAGSHQLVADEPVSVGGEDSGPTPHDLLAASLAACTGLTLTLYARHKKFDLQDVEVAVDHEQLDGGAYVLKRRIRYVGNLDEAQRTRLTEIANKCPLHKILSGDIRIDTEAE